jgi:hypothetical protein
MPQRAAPLSLTVRAAMRRSLSLCLMIVTMGCTSSTEAPEPMSGVVSLEQQPGGALLVSARFLTAPSNFVKVNTIGNCDVIEYRSDGIEGEDASAGTLTIAGITPTLVLEPNVGNVGFYGSRTSQASVRGGDQITFTGTGAEVPAFEGTIIAPSAITLTTSLPAEGLTVDDSQDLAWAWTGGGTVDVEVYIYNFVKGALSCRFPATDGSGTIPAAALQAVRTGASTKYLVRSISKASVSVGDWSVDLSAAFDGVWSDNTAVDGYIEIQ